MDQKILETDSREWLFQVGYRWVSLIFVAVVLVIGSTEVPIKTIPLVLVLAVAYTFFLSLGWKFLPKLFSRYFALIRSEEHTSELQSH